MTTRAELGLPSREELLRVQEIELAQDRLAMRGWYAVGMFELGRALGEPFELYAIAAGVSAFLVGDAPKDIATVLEARSAALAALIRAVS